MRALINKNKEEIEISKHSGATADQIKSYLGWWYDHYKPNRLVISAGANDLLYENNLSMKNNEDLCNEPEVVKKLMDIGLEARGRGVSKIYFCTLYTIKSLYDGYTSRFNQILERECQNYGFHIISNADIELGDLFDGLHVNNKQGINKLKHNILKECSDTYIHRNVKNIGRNILAR